MPVDKLTFEEFERRCNPEAKRLSNRLREFNVDDLEWELVYDHGNPTLRFDEKGRRFLPGIILPAGPDGWRVHFTEVIRVPKKNLDLGRLERQMKAVLAQCIAPPNTQLIRETVREVLADIKKVQEGQKE